MPVSGKIIRSYQKGKNDGIDIAARRRYGREGRRCRHRRRGDQGHQRHAIVVIRHADNLLTVYAGVDQLKVAKGATVSRGQAIAVVRSADPAFLHFEVRRGVDSVDPMPYLRDLTP